MAHSDTPSTSEASSSENDLYGRRTKSRKKRRRLHGPSTVAEIRFSSRNNRVMNYNEDEVHGLDLSDEDVNGSSRYYYEDEATEIELCSIDTVLDHKQLDHEDDNPKSGFEYYVSLRP